MSTLDRRRLLAAGAAMAACLTGGRAFAQAAPAKPPASAQVFLTGIYSVYLKKDGNGIDYMGRAKLGRYFTPALADLIQKDRQESDKKGEVPTLDFDPFLAAQDWEVTQLKVTATEAPDGTATAVVNFLNSGTPRTIKIGLKKLPAGWRIDDMDWGGEAGTLRGLYKR